MLCDFYIHFACIQSLNILSFQFRSEFQILNDDNDYYAKWIPVVLTDEFPSTNVSDTSISCEN